LSYVLNTPEDQRAMLAAIGGGALRGPFLSNWLTKARYLDMRLLFVPYIIRGIGDVLLAVTRVVPFAWVLLVIYGLNTSSGMIIYQTWVQRHVPDEVRGRVFTWLDVVWNVMTVVSLGIGAYLAEHAGVEVVYYLGGTLLLVAGVVGMVALRDERQEQTAPRV